MKRKIKFGVILVITLMLSTMCYASDAKTYNYLTKYLKGLLNAFTWFGYAIAVGILLFIAIKYILSGANERANLKGKFPAYVFGVGLMVLCATVTQVVANIVEQKTAGTFIDEAFNLANLEIQDGVYIDSEGRTIEVSIENGIETVTHYEEVNGQKIITQIDKIDANTGKLIESHTYDADSGKTDSSTIQNEDGSKTVIYKEKVQDNFNDFILTKKVSSKSLQRSEGSRIEVTYKTDGSMPSELIVKQDSSQNEKHYVIKWDEEGRITQVGDKTSGTYCTYTYSNNTMIETEYRETTKKNFLGQTVSDWQPSTTITYVISSETGLVEVK